MRVFASYNIKGGVGKTASAVNLAYCAAREGRRTLLWDLDPQGAASWYFRIEAKVKGGGERLLRKPGALAKAIRASDFEGLDLVPGDFSYRDLDLDLDAAGKARRRLARLLDTVREDYDVVFLDCPPSISLLSESVFTAADALLVPTIPTALSLRTLEQLAAHLKGRDEAPLLLPFFCLVDRRKRAHREILKEAHAAELGFLETAIPYASQVEQMGAMRRPVVDFAPRTTPARRFVELWAEVCARMERGASAGLDEERLRALYRPPRQATTTPIEIRTMTLAPLPAPAALPEDPQVRDRLEIEFKLKLSGEQDFEALARSLGHEGALPAALRQVNRFADTAERALAAAGFVLRVRSEGGRRLVTAKGPTLESSSDGTLTAKAEEEVDLGDDTGEQDPAHALAALVLERGSSSLVQRLGEVLAGRELEWIGTFQNERRKLGPIPLPGTDLRLVFELDCTRFPGGVVHFEAEVELPAHAIERARPALARLFESAGLPWEAAPSKAKRFFALLADST